MNLLLVEDDQMLGETICDGARQSGWHIDHVSDARAARAVLVDHAYAAVLLDIGLAEESGLSVLRSMRTRYDSTPVLILTARGQLSERRGLYARTASHAVSRSCGQSFRQHSQEQSAGRQGEPDFDRIGLRVPFLSLTYPAHRSPSPGHISSLR